MSVRSLPHGLVLLVSALLLLAACEPVRQPPAPSQQPELGARLLIDGDAVFVNGAPASYGRILRPGDTVTTGPGASALVRFSDGTTVQLDQNTDPVFSWTQQQIQIQMAAGLIETTKGAVVQVIRIVNELAESFVRSRATFEVERGRYLRADLFSGELRLIRPQRGRVITPGRYVRVNADGSVAVGRTSPGRVAELRQRLDRWTFSRVDQPPAQSPDDAKRTPPPPQEEEIDPKLKRWMERNPPGSPY